ncbi:ogr/Delta-like zinc finger family protein [Ursidibacter sp. B-7004-1]
MGKIRRMSRRPIQYCRECCSEAIILKTERIHRDSSRLYCRCKNPDCNHEFVMNLDYSHTTKASKLTNQGLLQYFLDKLPLAELENLQSVLNERLNKT